MNPTKRLKDEEASVLNEILKASHQKEVIDEDLNGDKAKSLLQPFSFTVTHMHRKHLEYGKARGRGNSEMKRTECGEVLLRHSVKSHHFSFTRVK